MSRSTKRFSLGLGVVVFSLAGILFIGASRGTKEKKTGKNGITLVAREMAFRVEHASGITVSGETNPTLTLGSGERVNILFRNEDPGVVHSFVLKGVTDRSTRPLRFGESEFISLTAPDSGMIEYFCSHHPQMMKGRILVSGSPPLTRRTQ